MGALARPKFNRYPEIRMAATTTTRTDFVSLVAEEIIAGIDHATEYWLARIEQEFTACGLTQAEKLLRVERVLNEYKETTGKLHLRYASA